MGARIQGAGTDKMVIQGVEKLKATSYEVQPDRIEGGTYLVAGAITSGHVRIKNTEPEHLDAVTAKLINRGSSASLTVLPSRGAPRTVAATDDLPREVDALQYGLRRCLIAGIDRLPHVLDRGAELRAEARIVLAALFALPCPLSG